MKVMRQLLAVGLIAYFQPWGMAADPNDILATSGKFKPTIRFGEVYSERLVTTTTRADPGSGDPPTVSREVVPNAEKITATVTADVDGLDLAAAADTSVALTIGGFSFSGALGDAKGFVEGKSSRAVFPFTTVQTIDLPNGSTKDKTVKMGTVTFAWTKKVLTASVAISDAAGAGMGDIISSSHSGESGISTGQPLDVGIAFGALQGNRQIIATSTSKVVTKRFGSDAAGTLEEYPLNSVTSSGQADVNPPQLVGVKVAPSAADPEGSVDISGAVTDLSPVTISLTLNGNDAVSDDPAVGDPDKKGKSSFSVANLQLDPAVTLANSVIKITAVDGSGNSSSVSIKGKK